MAFCNQCGKQLNEGTKFCGGCGAVQVGLSNQAEAGGTSHGTAPPPSEPCQAEPGNAAGKNLPALALVAIVLYSISPVLLFINARVFRFSTHGFRDLINLFNLTRAGSCVIGIIIFAKLLKSNTNKKIYIAIIALLGIVALIEFLLLISRIF